MSTTGNRFETYLGEVFEVHQIKERQTEKQRCLAELSTARAEELQAENERRRDSNGGHRPVDLWGQEAAAICDEFLEFAIRSSGDRRNLIGATYLRGRDPKQTYTESVGIFKKSLSKKPEL